MMDSIPLNAKVVVIGATNRYPRVYLINYYFFFCKLNFFLRNYRPDALDSTLRRPGRLDRELEIRAPTVAERKEIINVLLKKIPNSLEEKDIDHLASVTHGFVGADLLLLCAEASLAAAKRVISSSSEGNSFFLFFFFYHIFINWHWFILDSPENLPKIIAEDAKQALHLVKPSAMREVLVEVPDVMFYL